MAEYPAWFTQRLQIGAEWVVESPRCGRFFVEAWGGIGRSQAHSAAGLRNRTCFHEGALERQIHFSSSTAL